MNTPTEQCAFTFDIELDKAHAHRTLLRYPGGKSRAVNIVRRYFPRGLSSLVSSFVGGASIELACAADGIRVYGSDAFRPLVDFWNAVIDNAEAVHDEAVRILPMTHSRFLWLRENYDSFSNDARRAAIFYVLNQNTFGGALFSAGYAHFKDEPIPTPSMLKRLHDFEAKNLTVELLDFEDSLNKHPDTFAYLDPPYLLEDKSNVLYGKKGELHRSFNHDRLAAMLRERRGWVLSYNDCDAIRRLYDGFNIERVEWTYTMTQHGSKESSEVIIWRD